MIVIVTVPSLETVECQYRRFRTIGIVCLIVGVVAAAALTPFGAWWLGVLLVIVGLGLIFSALGQLRRNRYVPLEYDGPLDVVGESRHVTEIAEIYATLGGVGDVEVTAALLPDRANAHDSNAVAVGLVVGKTRRIVGYLPREIAAEVKPLLQPHLDRGEIPSATATIRAPFINEHGTRLFQVLLDHSRA